jgi:aminoglycoside phosphotransferase
VNDPLERSRFLEALRGWPRTLRHVARGSELGPLALGEACVLEGALPRSALRRDLRRLAFLAFPGTGGGFVLLSAGRPSVFRAGTVLLPRGRALTRLASGFVRESSRLGLHRLAPGRLTLVERADAPRRELHARFPGLSQGLLWNIASGVPGRDQKLVAQLVTPAGTIEAYAKLAHSSSARELVRHEASVLARLAGLGLEVPQLFGHEEGPAWALLVQGALPGRRASGEFGAAQARYLARIAQLSQRELPLSEIPSQRLALQRLEALAGRAERDWHETFSALALELARAAGSHPIACALAHGDFTPWNVLVHEGRALAYDWEHARLLAPCGHDALHFALQQAVLVEHTPSARLLGLLEQRCAAFLGTRPFVTLAAYLLDVALFDETQQLEQRSPFAQVDWLRRARLELARALLARAPAHGSAA